MPRPENTSLSSAFAFARASTRARSGTAHVDRVSSLCSKVAVLAALAVAASLGAGCNAVLGNEPRSPVYAGASQAKCGSAAREQDQDAGECPCEHEAGLGDAGCSAGEKAACSPGSGGACEPHALCTDVQGTARCECRPGFQRNGGDTAPCTSLCDSAGCDTHASCSIVDDRALCSCLAPYTGNGLTCSFDANCASHHCDQNARCLGNGPNRCVCSEGFAGDGLTCRRIDPCASKPCQNGGACTGDADGFVCDCNGTGFQGGRCELPIDDCASQPCAHGTCSDLVLDYRCECEAGYSGKNCETDVDDCAAQPCRHGACLDMLGGFMCTCPAGYSGTQCETDIDDCAAKPCVHGTCKDRVDGFDCSCSNGYSGSQCETDIDDCAAKPCVHGTCKDRVGSFECSCMSGYDGPRCEHDIDNCAANPCAHGTCSDAVNGYRCQCATGWEGDRCEFGSCSRLTCPSSAPCQVPEQGPGACYPAACGTKAGLCLAENPDGTGSLPSRLLDDKNSDFDFGSSENWTLRAHYFAYFYAVDDHPYVCVFPEPDYQGTPLMIQLGETRLTPAGYGQSNAWPGEKGCP
jgi:hypothetical protein